MSGVFLERMAEQAEALMLAEAVTQVDESAMALEEGRVASGGSTSHIGKNTATAARVDAHELTLTENRTKSVASDSMENNETKHLSWSEAERLSS